MSANTVRLAAAFAMLAVASNAFSQASWDLATVFLPTNYHVRNLEEFAADVARSTAGQLKINVRSAPGVFKLTEIKNAVQSGKVQAGEILMTAYESESGVFGVDGIPFLVNSYSSARKLYAAQKPVLQKYLERQGMVLLFCVPWPPSGIFTKRPIGAMRDMRGLRWRAYSPATTKMGELTGAKPVTVSAADLRTAVADGVVDSLMTSSQTGVDSHVYEGVKYFYDLRAALPKNAVFVNAAAFRALSARARAALLKAASDAEERGWRVSAEWDERSKATLAEKGVAVLQPSAKLDSDAKQMGLLLLIDWQYRADADAQQVVANFERWTPPLPTTTASPQPNKTK